MLNYDVCFKATQNKRNCEIIGLLLRDDDTVRKGNIILTLTFFYFILSRRKYSYQAENGL